MSQEVVQNSGVPQGAEPVEATEQDLQEVVDSQDAISESDREELEYQEAMRVARGGKTDEEEKSSKDEEEVEEEAPKEEKKKESRLKKFKVGKKEVEIDLNDEDTVDNLIQKGIGAQETFQEAAQMRKNAEAFVSALQKDPFSVLAHPSLKLDIRKLAEDYLWDQIQHDKMTPEQKSAIERDKKLKAYEEAEEMKKRSEEQERDEVRRSKQREYWTGLINNSLDKHSLPKIPWTLEETAKRMKLALENGFKDVTPDDIVPSVKEDFLAMRNTVLSNMDPDSLSNFLGKDLVSKINKNEIKKYKNSKFENKVVAPEQQEPSKKIYRNMEEFQQSLRSKHR